MTQPPHEIIIRVGRRNSRRQFYDVWFRGAHLVESIDPEFAACRELLKRGITGAVVSLSPAWSKVPSFVLDIERHARKRTFEPDAGRLRIGKHVEFKGLEEPEAEAA